MKAHSDWLFISKYLCLPSSNSHGICPENVPLFAEKNEFESSLYFIPIQIFTSMSVSGGEGGDEGLTI